ncbi:MAG: anti-sigma factor [Candidatus Tectimicrobiota bacterium]
MRCRRLQRRLLAYLEGELTPQQRQQMAAHLGGCTACSTLLQDMQQTWSLVQETPVVEPEEAYWEALLPTLQQRLRQEKRPSRRRAFVQWLWHAVPRPALAALATSLLLVSLLPLMRVHWQPSSPPVLVLAGLEEVSGPAEVDFLKHLDLLEEVDVIEDADSAF